MGTKEDTGTWYGKLFKGVMFTLVGMASLLYRAWGITVVWGWFFAAFTGIAALPIWVALGVAFVSGYLGVNISHIYVMVGLQDKIPEEFQTVASWLLSPFATTMMLFGGWIWTLVRPLLGI